MNTKITVDTSRWERRETKLEEILGLRFFMLVFESSGIFSDVMKRLAPVRSGKLAASITIEREADKVLVGPTVPYAGFVSHGTRPTPGRFVPAIERRLINSSLPSFGTHPGIAPNPYIENTVRTALSPFMDDVQRKLNQEVTRA